MSIIARTALLGLTVLIAGASTVNALAIEEGAWNQQEVTALAARFEQAVNDLANKAQNEKWTSNKGRMKQAEIYLLVEDIKTLDRHSRQLSLQVAKGLGRAETDALFRRLMSIVREIRAQRQQTPLLESSGNEIEQARSILEQLAAYYGEAMPPPVAAP